MGRNCSKEGKNRGKVKNLLCEVFDLLCRCSIIGCSGVCFVWLQGNLSDKFTRKISSKNPLGKTWRKREAKKFVENADVLAPARSTRTLARILTAISFFCCHKCHTRREKVEKKMKKSRKRKGQKMCFSLLRYADFEWLSRLFVKICLRSGYNVLEHKKIGSNL